MVNEISHNEPQIDALTFEERIRIWIRIQYPNIPNGWDKSLQCKSKAFDDVYDSKLNYSCKKSSNSVRDVINTRLGKHNLKLRRLRSFRSELELNPSTRTRRGISTRNSDALLTELPVGHPSRNIVEIIFQSSWISDGYPGRVDTVYKVENGSRTVTRFEEYREVLKSRDSRASAKGESNDQSGACEEDARCLADGNEMLRFYPLGWEQIYSGAWGLLGGKGKPVCTFSGRGESHGICGGGGGGKRALLICRVIAGRVC